MAGVICASSALVDGGRGVRFTVQRRREQLPAFAIRHAGRVHAYLNRCAHRGVELDWNEGEFFDASARELVCATHDARYAPDTGVCVSGPCAGAHLEKLEVNERDGAVWLAPQDGIDLAER